jgi:hypothetical protein
VSHDSSESSSSEVDDAFLSYAEMMVFLFIFLFFFVFRPPPPPLPPPPPPPPAAASAPAVAGLRGTFFVKGESTVANRVDSVTALVHQVVSALHGEDIGDHVITTARASAAVKKRLADQFECSVSTAEAHRQC